MAIVIMELLYGTGRIERSPEAKKNIDNTDYYRNTYRPYYGQMKEVDILQCRQAYFRTAILKYRYESAYF